MRLRPCLVILALAGCGDDKATTDATASAATTDATASTATSTTDATASTATATSTSTATSTATTDATTDATTGPGDGEPAKYSEACAPDDGAAVEFSIGVAARECTADFPEDAPIFRIVLYQGVKVPIGVHPLDGGEGFAYLDTGDGTPETGDVGTLTITSVTADGLVGTYDVTLAEGTHLSGSFDAIYCPQDVLCG